MSEIRRTPPAQPAGLLHTKLMPPKPHPATIPRAELLARLDESLRKRLTLLSAPTGFGKTTLVSSWLAARGQPAAWVTLDPNDNDPVRFWTYAISALRTLNRSLGRTALSALMATQAPPIQTILISLINDLALPGAPWLLVLDDYHAISSAEIGESVAFLLQNSPETLHSILISRSEPDLPLGILRARDELLELDSASLRFTRAETETFLRTTVPVALSAEAVAALQERTDGWPAGLRLMALSLQNKAGAADVERLSQSFSGSHRYVAEYLIREVFEAQPEATRDFLLRTCFLSRLTGKLCDAVTESSDGAAVLGGLERQNLFLAQLAESGGRTWYRYNPLFAEAIQGLAHQRLGKAGIRSIYENASAWYEYQQIYDEAVETALAAEAFERALSLVEKFIEIHELTEMRTLERWLEAIPTELLMRRPRVCFTYAQVILYSAANRFAPATAARLEPLLRVAETDPAQHGQVLSLRGVVVWWQGDLRAGVEYAHRSLEEIPEQDVFWRGSSLLIVSQESLNTGKILEAQSRLLEARALEGAVQNIHGVLAAIQGLSEVAYWQGDLDQAEQLCQQILTEAVGGPEMLDDQGFAALGLSNIAYERDDLDSAGQSAARALDLAGERGNDFLRVHASARLAYIHAARGEMARARDLLTSLAVNLGSPAMLGDLQAAQALLAIRAGDLASLRSWEASAADPEQGAFPIQAERRAFILARLRIAQGDPSAALDLLAPWPADAAENSRVRSQVESLCLVALARRAGGDAPKAAAALADVLDIAQEKGLRRLILDEGPAMAALLREILPRLTKRPLSLYAAMLLRGLSITGAPQAPGPGISAALLEPISHQEMRVLRLLAAGLSNAEIAQQLVVSTNTVKTQVKSIYRKLNVNSRKEAGEAARELRLL